MKKVTLLVITTFLCWHISSTQPLKETQVPAQVKAAFTKAHPGMRGKWEKESNNFEVSFKKAGKETSCLVDKNGTILETETTSSVTVLPEAIRAYLKQNHGKGTIKEVTEIVKSDGSLNYEVVVDKTELLFDNSGKLMMKRPDKED